jgi:hypothetical protein
VWICKVCKGRAVAVGMLQALLDADGLAKLWRGVAAAKSGSRPCPSCREAMAEFTISSSVHAVELDTCSACRFVWFDAGELTDLPQASLDGEGAQLRPNRPPVIARPPEVGLPTPPQAERSVRAHEAAFAGPAAPPSFSGIAPDPTPKVDPLPPAVAFVPPPAPPSTDAEPSPALQAEQWGFARLGMVVEIGAPARRTWTVVTWGAAAALAVAATKSGLWTGDLPEGFRRIVLVMAWVFFALAIDLLIKFGDNVEDLLGPARQAILLGVAAGASGAAATHAGAEGVPALAMAVGAASATVPCYMRAFPNARVGGWNKWRRISRTITPIQDFWWVRLLLFGPIWVGGLVLSGGIKGNPLFGAGPGVVVGGAVGLIAATMVVSKALRP